MPLFVGGQEHCAQEGLVGPGGSGSPRVDGTVEQEEAATEGGTGADEVFARRPTAEKAEESGAGK